MKLSEIISCCLLLVLLLELCSGKSHFFHDKKHSYKHDVAPIETKQNKVILHPYKMALPPQFIDKYEYELEFTDKHVMVQLDHATFSENISYVDCYDGNMNNMDICFKNADMLSEFINDLKTEFRGSNSHFVIASSNENQWKNCNTNMKEISLLRMLDLNNCLSDYGNNCLQCAETTKPSHEDIIQNGYITFHTNLRKANKDIIPFPNVNQKTHARKLLQSTITYYLSVKTCSFGGTDDDIWIIVEGDNGRTSPVYSSGMTSSGKTYTVQWNGINVGTIRKMYFVNYGNDDFRIYDITLNGKSAGAGYSWASCPKATFSGTSPDGCGVATIDFDANNYENTEETPTCITKPPPPKTPAPVQTPAPINPSGRTYSIDIHVAYHFGSGGSDDQISFIIVGESGTTSEFKKTFPNSGNTYSVTHFDEIDVGVITNVHLVNFHSDDLCFDKVVIDGIYIHDSTCLTCGSHCIGYNSWQESGCNSVEVDFVANQVHDIEEIPCSTIIISTGNIKQDSWVVNGLLSVLENVVGGDNTEKTTYTGTEQIAKSLASIDKTFVLQFDQLPSATINGKLSVENNLKLELQFIEGTVTSYFVGLSYDAGIELIMSLIVDTDVFDIDKKLFTSSFPVFGINVGFITFGIFVGMEVHGSISAEIGVNYECTFSYNVFGDVGLALSANGWSPTSSIDKDSQFECSTLSASAAATISVYPIFFVRIDYVLDNKNIITATAKPFIEASIQFDSSYDSGCYLNIGANFGLQVAVASQIVDNSWVLFNDKWPIFSGCIDSLLTITMSQIASLAQNAILYIANNQKVCSTTYSTTNRKKSIVSLICSQTDLQSMYDENNNKNINKTSHMFGSVGTVWNGRMYPLSTFISASEQTKALKRLNYETYQTVSINEVSNSADIVVLYTTSIEDYNSSGIPLNCFYTVLHTINDASLMQGYYDGIVDTECVHGQNVQSDYSEGNIFWWLYNFKQMEIHIAKRLFFAEFLTTKTFQTNVDFADLAFSPVDTGKTFYGGLWCNVCYYNWNSTCDSAIKSFELTLYDNGNKARLKTNYMHYSISDLDVSYNFTTGVTCIGDIICGSMAYTTEHSGNRYYFGEVINSCYVKTFCGHPVKSFAYDYIAGKDDILPLFVLNEYATTQYNDEFYWWESGIFAVNNTNDNCNMNSSNIFSTTSEPTLQPTTNESLYDFIYCGDTVSGHTIAEYDINYYLFEIVNDSSVLFDSCLSDYDTYIYLFDDNATLLTECDDCGSCGSRAQLYVSMGSGYYWLGIGGYSTNFGAYHIQVTCTDFINPPNTTDTHVHTISCGDSFQGDTTSENRWANYSFILDEPDNNGVSVTFSSCGSNYDTYLWLFNNYSDYLHSNDDSSACGSSSVLTTALYNGDYKLRIGGYNGAFGHFIMNVSCTNVTDTEIASIACGDLITASTTAHQQIDHYLFSVNETDNEILVTFSTCGSDYDTSLWLFYNYTTLLHTNDDSDRCGIASILTTDLLYNGDYVLSVGGYNGAFGNYVLNFTCNNPITEPVYVFCDDFFVGYTTSDEKMANYSFILDEPGNAGLYITFSLCGSDYDTYVWLFDNNSNLIYANDDSNLCGTASILTTNKLYNSDYKLSIGGFNGAFGNFTVNISCYNESYTTTMEPYTTMDTSTTSGSFTTTEGESTSTISESTTTTSESSAETTTNSPIVDETVAAGAVPKMNQFHRSIMMITAIISIVNEFIYQNQ
eukprot:329965_1